MGVIDEARRAGLRPAPRLTVSEWADQHRRLPPTAAEPGRWRTDRTPYLRAIMDCLSPSDPTERVVFIKGAQIGGTEAGLNWLGYIIHHAPGLTMLVQPSLDMAKRNTVTRIDPMIAATPALRDLVVAPRSREAGNSMFRKSFPAGELILTGANSAASLRSTPARYLFLDEVDGFPGDVDGEGDPVDLAVQRTATFRGRRKILMVSTPTLKGLSRIEAAYLESDQRIYEVPCDHCGEYHPITWADIRWPDRCRDHAYYACPFCGGIMEEHRKPALLAAGRWTATADGDGKTAGFHLSGLYSPWATWAEIALEHGRVKKDPTRLQVWTNTRLGETWEDREADNAPSETALLERREAIPDGAVPEGACIITVGVDTQDDRIEATTVSWGPGEECWILGHHIFIGDPAGPGPWGELDDLLAATWRHPSGAVLPVRAACIDTGGHRTQAVYDFVRGKESRRVWPIKGMSRQGAPIWPKKPTRTNKGRVNLYTINVDAAKDAVFARLAMTEPGPGFIHFCAHPTLDLTYFEGLNSERPITRYSKGRPVREWRPVTGRRNEPLDCLGYALAALHGLQALGLSLDREAGALTAPPGRHPVRAGLGSIRSSWVSG